MGPPAIGKSCSRPKGLSPDLFMLAPFPCFDLKAVTVFCKVRPSVLSKVFPGHFHQDTLYTGHQISLTGVLYCTPHSTPLHKNKAST